MSCWKMRAKETINLCNKLTFYRFRVIFKEIRKLEAINPSLIIDFNID